MFLDNFKPRIINRGLVYFYEERVKKIDFIDESTVVGVVEGSEDYEVKIDIENSRNSTCSCPYEDLCKHMVALYFEAFPDMSTDYLDNDYEEDYDWYDDDNEDDYYKRSYFIPPTNYDELLNNYIEGLSIEETRKLLRDILNNDKENTYNKYLKLLYENSKDRIQAILDGINRRIINIIDNSFSNRWDDYSVSLIEENDRYFLKNDTDPRTTDYLRKILNDTRLYCFEDKLFLCELSKEKLSEEEIELVIDKLRSYLIDLKNMGVKSLPKSNVLISLYELESKYDINKLIDDFMKNQKYEEYIDYVIRNFENIDLLYENFNSKKQDFGVRKDLSSTYRKFYDRTGNKEDEELSYFYGFIYNHNLIDLDELVEYADFQEKYYERILKAGNPYTTIQLYAKLQKKKELYEYLVSCNNYDGLRFYASFLDECYHKELLKLFKEKAYERLQFANNRKEYAQVALYVRAIEDLNNGRELVEEFIDELKADDRFRKRSALFDEIRQCLKR